MGNRTFGSAQAEADHSLSETVSAGQGRLLRRDSLVCPNTHTSIAQYTNAQDRRNNGPTDNLRPVCFEGVQS